MLNTPDHILVVIIAVVWPLYVAFFRFPRLRRAVAAGLPSARVRAYIETMLTQWSLAAIALMVWLRAARPTSDLGFSMLGGWQLWLGIALVVLALVILGVQARQVARDPELQNTLRHKLKVGGPILPTTPRELFLFHLIAVTAGICEELLYRGFLIWYLTQLFGLPGAVVGSSALFGLAHTYQGGRGIVQTGTVGLVFALVFVVTRTLWVPMLLHTLVDVNSGLLWYRFVLPGRAHTPAAAEPRDDTSREG